MNDLPDLVKLLVKVLVLPPTGPLIVIALGLAAMRWAPRAGRMLAWAGLFLLYALSTPFLSDLLVELLDRSPPLESKRAQGADAIVILGGGVRGDAPEYGGETLNRLTLERVRYGARVARLTGLPVLVSGGAPYSRTPEATLMRESLEEEFGVPVRWSEDRARNTRENAIYSARLLRSEGMGRVVLVAHSFDMRRARAEFAAAGLEVIPAPTGIVSSGPTSPVDFIPQMGALLTSYYASYEILANALRVVQAAR